MNNPGIIGLTLTFGQHAHMFLLGLISKSGIVGHKEAYVQLQRKVPGFSLKVLGVIYTLTAVSESLGYIIKWLTFRKGLKVKFESPLIIKRVNSHVLKVLCHWRWDCGTNKNVLIRVGLCRELCRVGGAVDALHQKAHRESSSSGALKEEVSSPSQMSPSTWGFYKK